MKYKTYLYNDLNRLKSEGKPISDTLSLFDLDRNNVNIKDLIGNSAKWIFSFSYNSCHICIDSILLILNPILNKSFKEKFVILAHFDSWDQVYAYTRVNKINSQFFYLLIGNSIGIKAGDEELPIFFKTNRKLIINQAFIVDNNLPEAKKYFMNYILDDIKNFKSADLVQ